MTRKDYERLARMINCMRLEVVQGGGPIAIDKMVSRISNLLAEDNERFDAAKFRAACYVKYED